MPTPKTQKMLDSEPGAEKSIEKWVKSRDISQISHWKDSQWLLEVTYHRGRADPGFFLGGGAPLKRTTIFMVFNINSSTSPHVLLQHQ